MSEKIVTLEEFASIRDKLRRMGRKVVLCHGVFDLLHYGHIEHLQEARGFGDVLVVSVTAAAYVNKGPGRPYFTDRQRLFFLANIACVDYVILSEAVTSQTGYLRQGSRVRHRRQRCHWQHQWRTSHRGRIRWYH